MTWGIIDDQTYHQPSPSITDYHHDQITLIDVSIHLPLDTNHHPTSITILPSTIYYQMQPCNLSTRLIKTNHQFNHQSHSQGILYDQDIRYHVIPRTNMTRYQVSINASLPSLDNMWTTSNVSPDARRINLRQCRTLKFQNFLLPQAGRLKCRRHFNLPQILSASADRIWKKSIEKHFYRQRRDFELAPH